MHDDVNKIKAAILDHGNPFDAEGDQLYNFMTHAHVPQNSVPQILNIDDVGQILMKIMLPNELMKTSVCVQQ